MASQIPSVTLTSGHSMPAVAMGTASNPPASPEAFRSAILDAIAVGYRHFDTASLYGTEQPLGTVIKEALDLGLVNCRDELFITTKLWLTDAHKDRVVPALQESLRNLQLEYVDLYLIHWPLSLTPDGPMFPFELNRLRPLDLKSVWEGMEECSKLGLTKSIGVSNFTCKKLEQLLEIGKIPPAVNQVEMHPVWQQRKLIHFCKEKGIQVTAFSPLGANGAPWGTKNVMECNVLKEIASERKKSLPQIALRWIYQQGATFVVKSFNKERMTGNIDIFDWELSKEELDKISQIPQARGCPVDGFLSPNGPFKTVEELWDGEI